MYVSKMTQKTQYEMKIDLPYYVYTLYSVPP